MSGTKKLGDSEREGLILAYIERYSNLVSMSPDQVFGNDDRNFWAYERLDELVKYNPDIAFELILKIMERTENEDVLDNLAAGPLEDVIRLHGPIFIERIEELSRNSIKFKNILRGVWQGGNSEIWERIIRAST